jgi:uncharacterized protein
LSPRAAPILSGRLPAGPWPDDGDALDALAHRPWPLPDKPWLLRQVWNDLYFAHAAVPVELLRARVPGGLDLDLYAGEGWITVVPFAITGSRVRLLPPLPGTRSSLELNLRTYVKHRDKAGVFFFTLEASNALFVAGAKLAFHLPYRRARMGVQRQAAGARYESVRSGRSAGRSAWKAEYRHGSDAFAAVPGTLEHFLLERYCLFSADARGRLYEADIHHRPWRVQPATASVADETLVSAHGFPWDPLPGVHFARRQEVLIWPARRRG